MISMVIVPTLLGVLAAREGSRRIAARNLHIAWVAYAVVWFIALYYLRYRWR